MRWLCRAAGSRFDGLVRVGSGGFEMARFAQVCVSPLAFGQPAGMASGGDIWASMKGLRGGSGVGGSGASGGRTEV